MIKSIYKSINRLLNPPRFVVIITNSKAKAIKGKLAKAFLDDCSNICMDNDIDIGTIYGIQKEYGISLDFSNTIPDACHQRFRNIWNIHQ